MGTFAMVSVIFTSITVGSGFVGTFVYVYRVLAGRRPVLSHLELFRRIRESREWFEYIAWIASECPTAHPLEEGAAARVLDLEAQLFDEPPPPQPLLCRLFSCFFRLFIRLFRAAKSFSATPTSDDELTNEDSRNKGKIPEPRHIPQPQISTAHGTQSATTKDGGKNTTHDSTSSAKSAGRSRKSTAHRAKSVTTKDSDKSAGRSRKSSAHRTKSAATKDGGKSAGRSRKSTAHRTKSAIAKDGGKSAGRSRKSIAHRTKSETRDSTSSGKSAVRSRKPTAHWTKSATHDSTSSSKSAGRSRKLAAHRTKSVTTTAGGKNATHNSTSSAQIARKSAEQHVITPLPKAHTPTSSNHVEMSTGLEAAYTSVALPSVKFAPDLVRPARKPLPSSTTPHHHHTSSKLGLGWYEKQEKMANQF